MHTTYRNLTPDDLSALTNRTDTFGLDVLHGLSERPKKLFSKYFYDDLGSELFVKITRLEEYYPTRCEYEILDIHRDSILDRLDGQPFHLVELGAGDGHKTNLLLEAALKQKLDFQYVPIDISEAAMRKMVDGYKVSHPDLIVQGVVSEYFDAITWITSLEKRRNLVLFLGSNIGNFTKAHARVFLRSLWKALNPGDLVLIGFDLKKDIPTMIRAYNDSEGLTARFNLNLLQRINRDLNADFDLDKFQFHASYDVFSGAIESYLVSLERQTVTVHELNTQFDFLPWEPIHMEYSYKYLESDIDDLARHTGFEIVGRFHDRGNLFTDSLWRVKKAL